MPANNGINFPGISECYMKSGKSQQYIWEANETLESFKG